VFPFWHDVIAPLLQAAEVRRIVEVGALGGEHTERILHRLGEGVELHVIDPAPAFDPAALERRFGAQYVFHRDLSVHVLGDLGAMDAALIDGDHNWYTVFTELHLLSDAARRAGAPLPLMILHDVGWPYGRRDGYYDPTNLPPDQMQPWRTAGIQLGRSELAPSGGMNASLAHAEHEGGPRNGVMTGIEDFIAGYDKPLRLLVLPTFYGLAILVEEERLVAQPALAGKLDWLESLEGKDMLLRLSEDVRLHGVVLDQVMAQFAIDHSRELVAHHLAMIKAVLLGETSTEGATPEGADRRAVERAVLDHLPPCLDAIRQELLLFDVLVVGGRCSLPTALAVAYLEALEPAGSHGGGRKVRVLRCDHGEGGAGVEAHTAASLARLGLSDARVRWEPIAAEAQTSPGADPLAVLVLLPGGGIDLRAVLEQQYPALAPGGRVLLGDLDDGRLAREVDQFRADHGIDAPIERIDRVGVWRKA
jgi:hypothetical protein